MPTQEDSDPGHVDRGGVLDRLGGLTGLRADADTASADLVVSPDLHQPYGIVHGGVYAALAERVAEAGGGAWLAGRPGAEPGARARTTVVGTQFLRAVREGRVHAAATPVHRGRGQQLWQVRMTTDEDGRERVVAVAEVRLLNGGG
ncbi:PaaI family thioesterase [Jatrophihabitans sp. YIM 134969]